jgi:DNA-binding XRE family transcriptional regulator
MYQTASSSSTSAADVRTRRRLSLVSSQDLVDGAPGRAALRLAYSGAPRRIDNFDALIGGQVETLRRKQALSLDALADRVGVSPPQMGRYEQGAARINAAVLFRIAVALGVRPSDMFAGISGSLAVS